MCITHCVTHSPSNPWQRIYKSACLTGFTATFGEFNSKIVSYWKIEEFPKIVLNGIGHRLLSAPWELPTSESNFYFQLLCPPSMFNLSPTHGLPSNVLQSQTENPNESAKRQPRLRWRPLSVFQCFLVQSTINFFTPFFCILTFFWNFFGVISRGTWPLLLPSLCMLSPCSRSRASRNCLFDIGFQLPLARTPLSCHSSL